MLFLRTLCDHYLLEKSLHEKYEYQIKDRDVAIKRLRDMNARLSTKVVDFNVI